jgi:hypothetical protein
MPSVMRLGCTAPRSSPSRRRMGPVHRAGGEFTACAASQPPLRSATQVACPPSPCAVSRAVASSFDSAPFFSPLPAGEKRSGLSTCGNTKAHFLLPASPFDSAPISHESCAESNGLATAGTCRPNRTDLQPRGPADRIERTCNRGDLPDPPRSQDLPRRATSP